MRLHNSVKTNGNGACAHTHTKNTLLNKVLSYINIQKRKETPFTEPQSAQLFRYLKKAHRENKFQISFKSSTLIYIILILHGRAE